VKPAAFEYHAPATLEEALALLGRYAGDAKVLAGGQSLVPMLAMRLARPAALVDLNRIAALERVEIAAGHVTFGALARQRVLEEDRALGAAQPLLAAAARFIGHPATRNRGTIAGSIAHGDPAAELPCAMLALEATYTVAGPGGTRAVPAERFHVGELTTDLGADEVLVAVEAPVPPPGVAHAFIEQTRRFGDFALVAVAVLAALDDAGRCTYLRVALAGVAPRPVRARSVERALAGERLTPARIAAAAAFVRDDIDPAGDVHATREYREAMAPVFTRRALGEAARRAGQGPAA
jgi:carbon-monoxide dehydrogenase medium subunit